MVRAWLNQASLPKTLWFKASVAAVFVGNRCTNSFLKLKTTEYGKRYGTKPTMDNLEVYGCLCFAHVAKEKRDTLDDNVIRNILVAYSTNSPDYELYDLEQGVFFTASSVEFVEEVFPGKEMVSELEDLLVSEER
jgi:hypothetical protein